MWSFQADEILSQSKPFGRVTLYYLFDQPNSVKAISIFCKCMLQMQNGRMQNNIQSLGLKVTALLSLTFIEMAIFDE